MSCPAASACDHPVSCSATALSEVTRWAVSVAIMPSPMLASVTRRCSRSWKSAAAAAACSRALRRASHTKASVMTTPSTPVARPVTADS